MWLRGHGSVTAHQKTSRRVWAVDVELQNSAACACSGKMLFDTLMSLSFTSQLASVPSTHSPVSFLTFLLGFALFSSYHSKYNIRVEDIMVRDVRYITLNCCYRDLHNVLLTGHLKTLALVESAGETQTQQRNNYQQCEL